MLSKHKDKERKNDNNFPMELINQETDELL
jgi:hypothetical protein